MVLAVGFASTSVPYSIPNQLLEVMDSQSLRLSRLAMKHHLYQSSLICESYEFQQTKGIHLKQNAYATYLSTCHNQDPS